MNRPTDAYETSHPRAASNSWMRVTCNRSAVSHCVVGAGGEDLLNLPRAAWEPLRVN